MRTLIRVAGALSAGVTAVVYLNFSLRVMPELASQADSVGIAKMQSFNREALKAPFMTCFFGAAGVSVYALRRFYRGDRRTADVLAAVGGVAYLGGFLITFVLNAPLNFRLDKVVASSPDAVPVWQDYLVDWTNVNSVRAGLSTLAALALGGAAFIRTDDREG